MYNEKLKKAYLDSVKDRYSSLRWQNDIFTKAEPYEEAFQKDLCMFSVEEFQKFLVGIYPSRYGYRVVIDSIIRRYVKWCVEHNVPGAIDHTDAIQDDGTQAMRKEFVSGPVHLQKCLDCIFVPDEERTLDSIYRCYFWLAYSGIQFKDIFDINAENVHLKDMEIVYNGVPFPIYRESIKTIKTCIDMDSYTYRHPLYSKEIQRKRGDGTNLLRGRMPKSKSGTIRPAIIEKVTKAYNSGALPQLIKYDTVRLSGFFYRAYEMERAGFEPDFSWVIDDNKEKEKNPSRTAILRRVRNYKQDYKTWKKTFFEQ